MLGFEWLAWYFGIFEKQGFKDFYYDLLLLLFLITGLSFFGNIGTLGEYLTSRRICVKKLFFRFYV